MLGSDRTVTELVLYTNKLGSTPRLPTMRNVWLSSVDRALIYLGYSMNMINHFDELEKEALIIDEYLFRLREDTEDVAPLSIEDMADYIISYQRS